MGGVQTVTLSLATGFSQWGKTHPVIRSKSFSSRKLPPMEWNNTPFPFMCSAIPAEHQVDFTAYGLRTCCIRRSHASATALARLSDKPAVLQHHGYQSVCPNGLFLYEPEHAYPGPTSWQTLRNVCEVRCTGPRMGWELHDLVSTFPRHGLCVRAAGKYCLSADHIAVGIALPRTRKINLSQKNERRHRCTQQDPITSWREAPSSYRLQRAVSFAARPPRASRRRENISSGS